MLIHVVQSGDTIQLIAELYGTPVAKIIQDNALEQLAKYQAIKKVVKSLFRFYYLFKFIL